MTRALRFAHHDTLAGLLVRRGRWPLEPADPNAYRRRELALYERHAGHGDPLMELATCRGHVAAGHGPEDVRLAWREFYHEARARAFPRLRTLL